MAKRRGNGNNNEGRYNGNFQRFTGSDEVDPRFQDTYIPERLPLMNGQKLIKVYVEGYDDVTFWRGIFDNYESENLTFEISVPPRPDLAKGKKIVVRMTDTVDPSNTILCVDSDFDYLFADQTELARIINNTPNIFHTYAYAAENYLCYAPSLHNICVKATKNDMRIFDFENFFKEYSRIIYPLFLWYAYSAQINVPAIFPLLDFRSSVKINYLDMENYGGNTLEWLQKQVSRKEKSLLSRHSNMEKNFAGFARVMRLRGCTEDNTYLFMQGHTLLENVVMPVLEAVCDRLRHISISHINGSQRHGLSLNNEYSNYNNSLQDVRNALLFNENYKDCFLYKKLRMDIESHLENIW